MSVAHLQRTFQKRRAFKQGLGNQFHNGMAVLRGQNE